MVNDEGNNYKGNNHKGNVYSNKTLFLIPNCILDVSMASPLAILKGNVYLKYCF